MTSTATDRSLPNVPAWYRLLPKPAIHGIPPLPRTSSLSQHHYFHDRSSVLPPAREDGPRRNTVHVPERLKSIGVPSDEYIAETQETTNGGSGSASPASRARSVEMADVETQIPVTRSSSANRENICLCPASPKIPRPRNCEDVTTACGHERTNDGFSLHFVPSASTSQHHRPESRYPESGSFKDHR
jgi:hypothetical protein